VYVTPLFSDPELGEWYVRAELENIATGQPAVQSYNHEPVHLEDLGNGRSRIHRGPKRAPFASEMLVEIDGLQHQVQTLHHEAQESADQLAALRGSRAFRLGNAALAPARWMRRRVRRQ
jgi:hypothetical protein